MSATTQVKQPGRPPAQGQKPLADPWRSDRAVVWEKTLTLGRQYWIEAPPGQRVGFCKQKMFRLREDIRLWTGPDKQQELWSLRTQKILDWHAAFALVDGQGRTLGSFRRRGWKSIYKPEWLLFDTAGKQIGTFTVDSGWMVFLRWQLGVVGQLLFPTTYHLRLDTPNGPVEAGRASERRRLWGHAFDVHRVRGAPVDLRVLVAMTVLSCIFSESQGA